MGGFIGQSVCFGFFFFFEKKVGILGNRREIEKHVLVKILSIR